MYFPLVVSVTISTLKNLTKSLSHLFLEVPHPITQKRQQFNANALVLFLNVVGAHQQFAQRQRVRLALGVNNDDGTFLEVFLGQRRPRRSQTGTHDVSPRQHELDGASVDLDAGEAVGPLVDQAERRVELVELAERHHLAVHEVHRDLVLALHLDNGGLFGDDLVNHRLQPGELVDEVQLEPPHRQRLDVGLGMDVFLGKLLEHG